MVKGENESSGWLWLEVGHRVVVRGFWGSVSWWVRGSELDGVLVSTEDGGGGGRALRAW